MAFELVGGFAQALAHLPHDRPARRILALLEEALRRHLHFIARHPESLFQSLWNTCWWYDSTAAAPHYLPPAGGWEPDGPPWERRTRLALLLDSWRRDYEQAKPDASWLCSLRPPTVPLGSAQRAVIPVDTDRVRCIRLAFSLDATRLFAWFQPVGRADAAKPEWRAWDADTGRPLEEAAQASAPATDATRSVDGRWRLECGGPDGGWGLPVRLIDAGRNQQIAAFVTDPEVNIQSVAFSPGGHRVIGGGWSESGEVMVWDAASGRRLAWWHPDDSVFAVAVSPDERTAAAGVTGGKVLLWDIVSASLTATLEGHEDAVQAVAFGNDGRQFATASYDGSIRIWDLRRVRPQPRLRGHPDSIVNIAFSTDGGRLVTESCNRTTWIWDGSSGNPVNCPYASDSVMLVGGTPRNGIFADDRCIVSLSLGTRWDRDGHIVVAPRDDDAKFRYLGRDIAWASDGRHFACTSHGRNVAIGTLELPNVLRRLDGHTDDVVQAVFSPDGRQLATASMDRTVRLWDVVSGQPLVILGGHTEKVTCVAFSPDSAQVVSSGVDRTVRVWDAASGAELACWRIEDPGVWSSGWSSTGETWEILAVGAVAFTADGRHIVTLSDNVRTRVWNPQSGVCLRTQHGLRSLDAVSTALPVQGIVRDGYFEVESIEAATVVARAPVPRELGHRRTPVSRPDNRAWAIAVGRHLYLWELRGPECGQ